MKFYKKKNNRAKNTFSTKIIFLHYKLKSIGGYINYAYLFFDERNKINCQSFKLPDLKNI